MRNPLQAQLLWGGAAVVVAAAVLAIGPPLIGFGMAVGVAAWWCSYLERNLTPQ